MKSLDEIVEDFRTRPLDGAPYVHVTLDALDSCLVDAVAGTLPGAAWQRCRTYVMRNLLARVPKSAQSFVATMVRTIFAQPDAASVHEQHARIVDHLSCSPSPRFRRSTGARCGATTRSNGSTRRSAAAPTSSAFSRTAPP